MYVYPNGSVSNVSAPISRSGSTYTLTGNLSEPLVVERNDSRVDGAGYVVRNASIPGQTGFGLVLTGVRNCTVSDLEVRNGSIAIYRSHAVSLRALTESNGTFRVTDSFGGPSPYSIAIAGGLGLLVANSENVTVSASSIRDESGSSSWMNGGGAPPFNDPLPFYATPPAAVAVESSSNVSLLQDDLRAAGAGAFLTDSMNILGSRTNLTVDAAGQLCNPGSCRWLLDGLDGNGVAQVTWQFGNVTFLPTSVPNLTAAAGVRFSNATGASIRYNELHRLLQDGFAFDTTTNSTLLANDELDLFGTGIDLLDVAQVTVASNTINGALAAPGTIGIWSHGASQLVLEGNTVTNSTVAAVHLDSDDGDLVAFNLLQPGAVAVGDGIDLNNVTRIAIRNNTIGGWSGPTSVAVNATRLLEATLEYNVLSASTNGLLLNDCHAVLLRENFDQYSAFGSPGVDLQLVDSSNLEIQFNQFQYSYRAIVAQGGGNAEIASNNLSIALGTAVSWSHFDNLSIVGNQMGQASLAVSLLDGSRFNLTDNNLAPPVVTGPASGFALNHVYDGRIANNNLSEANVGVQGVGAINLTVVDNTAFGGGFAVLLSACINVTVAGNLGGNLLEGIEIDSSANVTVRGNRFGNTLLAGFAFDGSSNLTLAGDVLLHPVDRGILLTAARNVVITATTVSGANASLDAEGATGLTVNATTFLGANWSLILRSVGAALFVHNNFEYDAGWIIDRSSTGLLWDGGYPVGGNFWSNDTGPDQNGSASQSVAGADGIVDRPFDLGRPGADRFPLVQPWSNPTVTFVARGLPSGTRWSVSLLYGGAGSGTVALSGRGGPASTFVPFAAYTPFTYHVGPLAGYVPSAAVGAGTTGAGAVVITLNFSAFRLPISFHAAGVGAGFNWTILVDGTAFSGTTAWINVTFPNGSHAYSTVPIPGYYVPTPGVAVLSGAAVTVEIPFVRVVYSIFFVEKGLPNGTHWQLTVGGSVLAGIGGVVELKLPNGSYPYTVAPVRGYTVDASNGTFAVNGFDRALGVLFVLIPTAIPTGPSGPPLLDYLLGALAATAAAVAAAGWIVASRRRPPAEPGEPEDRSTEVEPMPAADADRETSEY